MSLTCEYLDRIRQIRGKYGSYQNNLPQDPYPQKYPQRSNNLSYHKPQIHQLSTPKYAEFTSKTCRSPSYFSRTSNFSSKPRSIVDISHQPYSGMKNDQRQINREKQFDKIRKNYAQSRKKVIQDFSSRTFSRYCSKEDNNPLNNDYSSNHRQYPKNYSRSKELPLHPRMSSRHKNNIQNESLHLDNSISPIKQIMPGYDDRLSYRKFKDNSILSSEKEPRLSAFTDSQLNENRLLTKNTKPQTTKQDFNRQSYIYSGGSLKSSINVPGISSLDIQNRVGKFSVSNIDRIQKRIKQLLDNK